MKKKIFTLFAALTLSAGALFASNTDVEGIYYNFDATNFTATVTYRGSYSSEYDEYTGNVVIPATVTYGDKSYSVTSIGYQAFDGCSGLTSVTIPNSVTSIGMYAFEGCSGLTSITIPNSVTSIGEGAFKFCRGLTSVTIPNSVTSIGDWTFAYCSGLTSITIPNSVTSIGEDAFYNCSGLTSVTIPNSVTSIGDWTFAYCSGLTSIVVESGNTTYDSRNGCNAIIETATNTLIVGCQSTIIPNSVTSIGYRAFLGCSGLTSITILNSVTSIGNGAFYGCSGVTNFICEGTPTFDEGEDYALTNFPKLDSIAVPAECFDIPEMYWVSCPKQVRYIKIMGGELSSDAFSVIQRNYKVLNTLNLTSATNTTLADEAFKGCYALKSLSLPSELQTIGYMALADCKNLQSIHVPSSVTDIDDSAFENCRSVTSITFGDALQSAPQLRSTGSTSNSQLRRIGNWGFYNCHNLQSLTIPEGVEEIGTAAFYGCTYLEELSLPSSVQSIGDNCFALASKLAKITVNAVTPPTIEAKTFAEVDRTIPVVVPVGSLSQYTADLYWSEFLNISESSTLSIDDVLSIGEFYVEPGRIVCEGEFRIYDLLGCDVTHQNGNLHGIYILKTPIATQKVLVK